MAERVDEIETIVTGTEVEALHLEQNLVKRHRPPFNVRLRDDKSFPYIAVTVEDDFPRVMFTRERHRRGVVYFGPYANAKKVRETLDVLNRVFRYRPCEGPQPGRHSGIPCLDFHIERCFAPCVGYISQEDYRGADRPGDRVPLRRRPADHAGGSSEQMRQAAGEERFEDAARYRNRLRAVERLSRAAGGRAAVDRDDRRARDRRLGRSGRRCRCSRCGTGGWSTATRSTSRTRPARSSTRCSRGSASSTTARRRRFRRRSSYRAAWGTRRRSRRSCRERRGSHVEVRAPERGEKRRLQELAQQNAELALQSETFVAETKRARRVEALEELREVLNLESLPIRIECFDISNIAGPRDRRLDGRLPGRRREEGALPQVHGAEPRRARTTSRRCTRSCSRRFTRLAADPGSAEWNESFAATPNLVVVDGGKGQLAAALAAMRELDLPRVAVSRSPSASRRCSCPGAPSRSCCPEHSPGLQLLQRIRDEAHRFAITFHRQRRDAASRESMFDQIEGVGPARRRALLQHFGSAERVLEAIAARSSKASRACPAKTARRIYAQLHRRPAGASGPVSFAGVPPTVTARGPARTGAVIAASAQLRAVLWPGNARGSTVAPGSPPEPGRR